jgi:hypothetical protein
MSNATDKLYAERDVIAQMQHYVRHVEAMTAEGLHSKSDIAAELAHRDIEIERLSREVATYENGRVILTGEVDRLRARVRELEELINTPHTAEFLEAVKLEAVHQRERWGSEHDYGKTDADWFWLVGYLTGKAIHKPEKQLHHIITTAAALLNWHAAKTGADTRMRPGITPPDSRGPSA